MLSRMMALARKIGFWALFLVIFATASYATDPWSKVDEKVYKGSLCEAFIDQASYVFQRRSCSAFGCDEWLYQVRTFCGPAPDGNLVATIEQSSHGRVFSRQTLTESRWREFNGNLLRIKASAATSFGKEFRLERVEAMSDGRMRVEYSIRTNGSVSERGHWVLVDGPSVPQVIERVSETLGQLSEVSADIFVK